MSPRVLALLALVLLIGCGPQYTHWESTKYPSPLSPEHGAQFDRDKYECQRENTFSSAYANRYYGTSGTEVNYELAMGCMKARGWYPVEKKR
jgi:hypothetical protein